MANTQMPYSTESIFREQYQLIVDLFTALNATEPIEEIVCQLAHAFSSALPFTHFRFSLAPWGWFWVVNEGNMVKRQQSKKIGVAYQAVIDTQQSLFRKNVAKEQRSPADKNLLRNGHHSVLIVPICTQNEAIGALHFLHSKPDTYDKVHLHLIETLVPLFVPAVVQLRNRLETEAMDKISQTLRQTRDLNTLSTLMLNHICDQGYDRVRIYLYNQTENELVGLVQTGGKPVKQFNGRRLPIAEDPYTQQTFQKKEPQIYKYTMPVSISLEIAEKRINTTNSEWAEFPLIVTENNEDHIVGKISLDNATSREPLNLFRLQHLTSYLNHAAIALHNALLYKQASEQAQDLTLQVQTQTASLEQQSQRLEDNNRLLNAFQEIGRSLLATLNLYEIIDILSVQIVKVGLFENMMVALVDQEHQTVEVIRRLHIDSHTGKPIQVPCEEPTRYDLNDSNITAEIARTGNMEVIEGWDDRYERKNAKPDDRQDRVAYFIPVKKDNHVLAVLATGSTIPEKPIMMARIKIIQPLLNQVAVAIEHARLHQEHQRTIQTQKSLITISSAVQKMTRAIDIEAVLQTCLNELVSLGLNICTMATHRILNTDQSRIETFRIDLKGSLPGSGEHTQRPTLIKRWKNHEVLYVEDLETESEVYINAFRSRLNNHPIRSFIDIPFALGILSVHSTHKKAISHLDQNILQKVADLISIGFARLADLEKAADHTHQQNILLTIANVVQKMTRSTDLEQVIRVFLEQMQAYHLDVQAMVIQRATDEKTHAIETYCFLLSGEFQHFHSHAKRIYELRAKNQTIYYPDLQTDLKDFQPSYLDWAKEHLNLCLRSLLILPYGGGTISLCSAKPNVFSPSTIHFMERIVGILSLSIERLEDLENLEQSNAQLKIHATEMERFTYTVSHDLKSPLITIRGYLGHIEKNAQKGNLEYVNSDLARIDKAATHMGDLLDDLLELSRIGRINHLPEVISLNDLARQACDMLTGIIETHHVNIDIAPNLPHIFGDRLRLLEVMQNLIENAIKFTNEQPNPRIKIGVRTDAEQPICYIQDNGIGIEPRYHNKIFGLFDKLNKQTEGTGIGLALVRRILQHHEQKIWVESEGTGKGSTFCFTLPLPKDETQNQG